MANVYGGADGVLVGAAYRAAMANVPLDMAAVYEQREQNLKTFTDAVGTLMKPKFDYNKESWDYIQGTAKEVRDMITSGDSPFSSSFMDSYVDVVDSFDKRYKSIPNTKEGDRQRMELEQEMNRFKNLMQSNEDMMEGMLNNSADGRLMSDLNSHEREIWKAVVTDAKNKTNETKPVYENGDWFYSDPNNPSGPKLSMSQINKALSAKDSEFLTKMQGQWNDILEKAKTSPEGMKEDNMIGIMNHLEQTITNDDQIRNLEQHKFGNMKYSFKELINGQGVDWKTGVKNTNAIDIIFDAIHDAGGVDMQKPGEKGYGVIDQADRKLYTTAENADVLLNNMTMEQRKKIVLGFHLKTTVEDYYKQGEQIRVQEHLESINRTKLSEKDLAKQKALQEKFKNYNTWITNKDWGKMGGGNLNIKHNKNTGRIILMGGPHGKDGVGITNENDPNHGQIIMNHLMQNEGDPNLWIHNPELKG